MNERDELLARLRDVTEDDAYEAPWTFGVHCRAAADQIERDGREIERLREALTPSGETKYAYIDAFSWTDWVPDENGIEQGHERVVPWTTIKEIMAAIRARAALNEENDHD